MIDRIEPAAVEIINGFQQSYAAYLDSMYAIVEIVTAVYVVIMFLILFFVWLPYLGRLAIQILRTKSLMNVIPIQTLKKNKGLKDAFTSTGILAAVK